ncbi:MULTISPECIES: hypothetical protein [unclassified Nocardioides]|uniref:hypothetical protein n=1 Tax=unclassified Nocardioides TaxID=2615069 RepID=UPI00360E4ADF
MHRTDAHSLAAILHAVNESSKDTILQRWGDALDVHPGKPELAQRHAEVVGLYTATLEQIAALPDDKRQRYEPFTTAWWTAIVSPDAQWRTKGSGPVLAAEHLALLNGVGDVIEARMDATSSAPGGFNLEQIGEQCDEWLEALNDTDALPEAFRRSLTQSVGHVRWLIENVELFGTARVARAANVVTGEVIQAIPRVREEERRNWAVRLARWTALLAAYSAFATAGATAIESTEHLVEVTSGVAIRVVEALEAEGDIPKRPAIAPQGGQA